MRIIGGKYRRRRFDVPTSFNARPTTDFAKENLFNVLTHYIDWEGMVALDLFAGTGSISAELISRGCRRVVSVEQRREHAVFIRSVMNKLGEQESSKVLQIDALKYLKTTGVAEFDFVFADPPYKLEGLVQIPDMILASGKLHPGAMFVLEHPDTYNFENHPCFVENRVYGAVNFSLFEEGRTVTKVNI